MLNDNYVYPVQTRARTHTYEMGEWFNILHRGGEKAPRSPMSAPSRPRGAVRRERLQRQHPAT